MFRKRDEDEERKELPDFVKLVIILCFIVGSFIGICKFTDWAEEQDMKAIYQEEYYEDSHK